MKKMDFFKANEIYNTQVIMGGNNPDDGDVDKDKLKRPSGNGGNGTNN